MVAGAACAKAICPPGPSAQHTAAPHNHPAAPAYRSQPQPATASLYEMPPQANRPVDPGYHRTRPVLYDLPVFSVLLLILVGADQHAGRLWPQRPQHIFDQGARMQPDQSLVHSAQAPALASASINAVTSWGARGPGCGMAVMLSLRYNSFRFFHACRLTGHAIRSTGRPCLSRFRPAHL